MKGAFMKEELRQIISADMKRYYDKVPFLKPIQVRYLIVYRKASYYKKKSLRGLYYRMRLHMLSEKSGIQLPTKTQIGKGLFIGHFGTIIVNPDAVIGNNVNIAPGVIIGKANRGDKKGVPQIGNDVWIGANAVIVGQVVIGDDVLIAPNAYVNMDVPPHSIVLGNPAVIHSRENATEGYINRRITVS